VRDRVLPSYKTTVEAYIFNPRFAVLLSLDVVRFWAEALVEFILFLTFMIWGSHSDGCGARGSAVV
jgi:hypothetical protein